MDGSRVTYSEGGEETRPTERQERRKGEKGEEKGRRQEGGGTLRWGKVRLQGLKKGMGGRGEMGGREERRGNGREGRVGR